MRSHPCIKLTAGKLLVLRSLYEWLTRPSASPLGHASVHRSASVAIAGSASDVGTARTELNAPAPIALFVFRRLEHVQLTVEALAANELASESELYIFCDGPRSAHDEAAVSEVRNYVKTVAGFAQVTVIEREKNIGLAQSIISGVTDVVSRHGRVIVVEDDLITSNFFLRYMNDGLRLYEHDERVASIHGYIYPISRPVADTFFLRGADCWGGPHGAEPGRSLNPMPTFCSTRSAKRAWPINSTWTEATASIICCAIMPKAATIPGQSAGTRLHFWRTC